MVVTHGTPVPRGRQALTVGNFDGVHRGHQAMLARLIAKARELGVLSCVLTFEPQPREFFAPHHAPSRLARLREKIERFAAAGVDRVHVARFDARLATLAPERFGEDVLVHGLGAAWLLVGRDFRYGARRAGDLATLSAAAARHGFELETMADVSEGGERISSSAVRAALEGGDFARAERLLGRPYEVSGRVAHGRKLGREMGFPTANIVLRRRPPLAGVYVAEVHGADAGQPDRWLRGAANIGLRPTVNQLAAPLLEVHLLDFARELYGRHLRVRFLAKLRDEEKYADLHALREAIGRDVEAARRYIAHHG